jgi:hypothetical protein
MAKVKFQSREAYNTIFGDLERYLDFCRDYGYRFNESDLYNFKSYPWQQYSKFINGKNAKNMWSEDTRKFSGYRRA